MKEKELMIMAAIASLLVAILGLFGQNMSDLSGFAGIAQKIIRRIFSSGRIFNGFIYIPIGMILSKKRKSSIPCWILFMSGFLGRLFINNQIIVTYLLIISSVGLFGIIEKIELTNSSVYRTLRSMSTTMYLIHLMVWTFYYTVAYGEKTYGLDCFIIVSVISSLIAFVVAISPKRLNR